MIRSSGSATSINQLKDENGVSTSDDYEMACIFNRYFSSISTIDDSNVTIPDFPVRTNASLDIFQITPNQVRDILQILKVGKASGSDYISHQMLKKTCDTVCVPLALLFNISLSKAEYPTQWKIAIVMPLFKNGDKTLASNYRPIALLSTVGKVFEKLVFKKVFNYLFSNGLIYKFQSGFMPGHSTVHQLIEIYYRICMSLDDHCTTFLIFCDISKAFDRVWHLGLLLKLKAYGINGKLYDWFESYISDRRQSVFIGNVKSSLQLTNAGVPQGSVLGPLLFLLYVNDIADNLISLSRLFADDTSLSFTSASPYTIEDVMNGDLEILDNWSKQWLVKFNPQKTKALAFSSSSVPNDIDIKFQDEVVEFVSYHKHLGITFDSDGKFHSHIENIVQSVSNRLSVMRKLKYILTRNTLSRIYLTFIRPLMEYACELWDGCSQRESDSLEKLQLEAGRIVTGLPLFASRDSIYYETGWELLSERRRLRRLSLFFNIHKNSAPEYLSDLMPPSVGQMSDYNLRNNNNYIVPNCRLEITKKSFFPSTITDWNGLDQTIRDSRNVKIFKSKINPKLEKPPSYFNYGNRKLNILHTRLRHMCSSLSADLHRVNIVPSASCLCGHAVEDCIHYFLECPIYVEYRQLLFTELSTFNITIELLLAGDGRMTYDQNIKIFSSVHSYIKRTNRFSEHY